MEVAVRWQLELGDMVIARIDADSYSFPFTYGRMVGSPAFERFRLYFSDPDNWPDDDPQFEALCREIRDRGRFVLREMTSGIAYRGVCLNHDGRDVVWFRHGDPA
ncbi:MAG: hypothetical protein IT428_26715 [Planctomycetaceae bacterium]|nr:hypothetical protein [Planctomycetaceae bacterium]